jgi:hypothetical protein
MHHVNRKFGNGAVLIYYVECAELRWVRFKCAMMAYANHRRSCGIDLNAAEISMVLSWHRVYM